MFLAADPILMDLQKAKTNNKRKREDGVQPLANIKRDKKQNSETTSGTKFCIYGVVLCCPSSF